MPVKWVQYKKAALAAICLLAGCTVARQPPEPAFHLYEIQKGGSVAPVPERQVSSFVRMMRARLARTKPAPAVWIAFEADVPEGAGGEGAEGAYLAILRTSIGAELRYIEQVNHQPRGDRYFHRPLTAGEFEEWQAKMGELSLGEVRLVRGDTDAVANAAEEAGAGAAFRSLIHFRLTRVDGNSATMAVIDTPGPEDHPAIDLVDLMGRLRDGGKLTCVYVQPLSPTVTLLYADVFKRVVRVWAKGDDLRVAVVRSAARAAENDRAEEGEEWLAYREGKWVISHAPENDEAATQPAAETQAADTRPAATQAETAATQPSVPRLLPQVEHWMASSQGSFTAVRHYVPIGEWQGVTREFWVPTLVFDNEHMWVDAGRGVIYVIHEGHLFSVQIPAGTGR